MTQETKDKIAKVYELVNRGEAGEKEAAKLALDRLMKKYNLSADDIDSLKLSKYSFKYANNLEMWLLNQIAVYFLDGKDVTGFRRTLGVREVVLSLEYVDYVIVSAAYEYFRRHMMAQYKKLVLPQVKRCRSAKTKNARRAELQEIFYGRYIVASKLYREKDLKPVDFNAMTTKELKQRGSLGRVEGGQYHSQVTTGLYLE